MNVKGSKLTKNIIGYDANSLHLYCSGDVMPCGADTLVMNEKPFDQQQNETFLRDVLKGKVFGFAQVDIDVPLLQLSEMVLLFVGK